MDPSLALAIAAIIIAPVVGYVTSIRKLSGRIGTSEAESLWDESRSIRDDYKEQIGAMRKVIDRCQERIDLLEQRNQNLYLENGKLARMLEEHEQTIGELRLQIHRLSDDNDRLRKENETLTKRVKELENGVAR